MCSNITLGIFRLNKPRSAVYFSFTKGLLVCGNNEIVLRHPDAPNLNFALRKTWNSVNLVPGNTPNIAYGNESHVLINKAIQCLLKFFSQYQGIVSG